MPQHPNSLANLRPHWDSRTAPKGRKNAGLSIIEWINVMGEWTTDAITDVADDPATPHVQRVAARRLLDESDPWGIVDYTAGKPKQSVRLHEDTPRVKRIIISVPDMPKPENLT